MVYSPMKDGTAMRQKGTMFKKDKRSGITLVELMMALIVMAIAIIGVVSVMLHSMKAKEITREFDIAKEAAATKLESMRSNKWDQGVPAADPWLAELTSTNSMPGRTSRKASVLSVVGAVRWAANSL